MHGGAGGAAAPAAPKAATFALTAASQSGALRLRSAAGYTVRGAVIVRNVSRRRITVRLQRADIRNAANGNADYATTQLSAAGRWVSLAATTVRLAPNGARRISFSVRIPARARAASHYAGARRNRRSRDDDGFGEPHLIVVARRDADDDPHPTDHDHVLPPAGVGRSRG